MNISRIRQVSILELLIAHIFQVFRFVYFINLPYLLIIKISCYIFQELKATYSPFSLKMQMSKRISNNFRAVKNMLCVEEKTTDLRYNAHSTLLNCVISHIANN